MLALLLCSFLFFFFQEMRIEMTSLDRVIFESCLHGKFDVFINRC